VESDSKRIGALGRGADLPTENRTAKHPDSSSLKANSLPCRSMRRCQIGRPSENSGTGTKPTPLSLFLLARQPDHRHLCVDTALPDREPHLIDGYLLQHDILGFPERCLLSLQLLNLLQLALHRSAAISLMLSEPLRLIPFTGLGGYNTVSAILVNIQSLPAIAALATVVPVVFVRTCRRVTRENGNGSRGGLGLDIRAGSLLFLRIFYKTHLRNSKHFVINGIV
jgi:hypothetical protein